MTVFRSDVFKPASIITEKISETPRLQIEGEPKERQVPVSQNRVPAGIRLGIAIEKGCSD
jgi:hypothetical protein